MTARYAAAATAALTVLVLAGCQGSSPVAPGTSAGIGGRATLPGTVVQDGAGLETSVPGLYQISIDPQRLQATSRLLETRRGQENDDKYLLPINEFLRPDSLTVNGIRLTETALELDYTFTHPFPSSDTIGRADLGVSGILLVLADVPTVTGNEYFDEGSGSIVVNTDLVRNPDAYWEPAGLLELSGYTANTFPYKLMVNDAGFGNRIDAVTGNFISNGNNPRGSFDADIGWQGPGSSVWTGFDVLHQGQAATGVLEIDRDTLQAHGSFDFTVAVIIKYADPKSASPGFEHRMPADPPDVLGEFGYRYPHGAWDCSTVEFAGESAGWQANTLSSTQLRFRVRDWDARAETSTNPLAEEWRPYLVKEGEPGFPDLYVSVPALFGGPSHVEFLTNVPADDSPYGGDPEDETGLAGDELFFAGEQNRDGDPADVRGVYRGLVRVADHAQDEDMTFLDGGLAPITGTAPRQVTYQRFDVQLQAESGPSWVIQLGEPMQSEGWRNVRVDLNGNVYVAGVFLQETDFGGGPRTSYGESDNFLVKLDSGGNYLWDRTWGGPGYDDPGQFALRADGFQLGMVGAFYEEITLDPTGPTYTPVGTEAYFVQLDDAGGWGLPAIWGNGVNVSGYGVASRSDGGYYMAGYFREMVDFGGGPVDGGLGAMFLMALDGGGTYEWVTSSVSNGVTVATDVEVLPLGDPVVAGYFRNDIDLGGGNHTSSGQADIFVTRYDQTTGVYKWDNVFGSTENDRNWDLATGWGGAIAMSGETEGDIDLGGGLRTNADPGMSTHMYVVSYGPSGDYRWDDFAAHAPGTSRAFGIDFLDGPMGDLILVGQVSEATTFAGETFGTSGQYGVVARLDHSTGLAKWINLTGNRFAAVEFGGVDHGPDGSITYIGEFDGTVDFAAGAPVAERTASSDRDIAVVHTFADGTW